MKLDYLDSRISRLQQLTANALARLTYPAPPRDYPAARSWRGPAPHPMTKFGNAGAGGAAAQRTHPGASQGDAGLPRAMEASSAPPAVCHARHRVTRRCAGALPDFRRRALARDSGPHDNNNTWWVGKTVPGGETVPGHSTPRITQRLDRQSN